MDADLAVVAGLLGDATRAAMLSALMGGVALPAGELARRARVRPSTASEHLSRLVDGGLVTRRMAGRHRYYALANEDVAGALEALARISPVRVEANGPGARSDGAFRFARTCYDHIAGTLGVLLADTLAARGLVSRRGYEVTESGEAWLRTLGIDVTAMRSKRRPLSRPCLDWTERRNHLAGGVGAALATTMLDRRWLARIDGTRAVRVTLRGREALHRTLGVELGSMG